MSVATKQERLEVVLTPEQKELYDWVASTHDQTLEEFVVSVLEAEAEAAIRGPEQYVIPVSPQAYRQLLEAIESPPEPNEHLKAAYRDYLTFIGETERE